MTKKSSNKTSPTVAKIKAKDLAPRLDQVVKGGKAIASMEQESKSSRESRVK